MIKLGLRMVSLSMVFAEKDINWKTDTPTPSPPEEWEWVYNTSNPKDSYYLDPKTGEKRNTLPGTNSSPKTNFGFWNSINIQLSAVFGDN